MPHFVSAKNEIMQNVNDITSDFACLKVSALKKASRISGEIDRITIGPDSTVNEDECINSENIENEQNSCNVTASNESNQLQNNKSSSQNGITFSVKKILLESEYQRKEEVRKEIERHWQHMKESGRAIKEHMAISHSHMAEERERKSKENYAYILAEEKIAEQEEIRRRNEQQKEVEEYRRRIGEKMELTKKITSLRNTCGMKYRDIVALSENCKDKNSAIVALSSYVPKLEEAHRQTELIDEKIKLGEVTPADLSTLEKMITQVDEILLVFKTEIERINVQYEENLAKLMENAAQSQAQPKESQKPEVEDTQTVSEIVTPEQTNTDVTQTSEEKYVEEKKESTQATKDVTPPNPPKLTPEVSMEENASATKEDKDQLSEYVDKESLQIYLNSQKLLENYAKTYEEFLNSASMKKFRFECKKAVNIPVNAISGINEQHLRDKYESLHNLLIGKSSPNVNQYPQGAIFCKNILAKQIINQGETLVSSKPKMAFPIAAVVVALWNDHSDFGDLLLAHFHSVCPFTVPIFMPKMIGQSNESYYKLMGYKYSEDGTVEKHDKFLKRMSGVMRLYASITITSQRNGVVNANPYGLQHAWRWLAAVLNIEPRKEISDLCATLLLDMLEVAGNALWAAYPKQFRKLLILLSEEYLTRMQKVGCIGGGPLARFEEFLKNVLTKGSIPPPDGQLPPNFW